MFSTTFEIKNVKVKIFGKLVDIPNDPIAKLMYYLNCINEVINYESNTLIDYENYKSLSIEEANFVYRLAKVLNPHKFTDAGIFRCEPNFNFNGSGNGFFKRTDETKFFHVDENIMIEGKSVKVLNGMIYNNNWLSTYYYNPIDMIEERKRKRLGIEPVSMICFYCLKSIVTKTSTSINCLACLCCLCATLLYLCHQCCNGKNICCINVTHRCPSCGRILGKYSAC